MIFLIISQKENKILFGKKEGKIASISSRDIFSVCNNLFAAKEKSSLLFVLIKIAFLYFLRMASEYEFVFL